jgi:hypothetical protein
LNFKSIQELVNQQEKDQIHFQLLLNGLVENMQNKLHGFDTLPYADGQNIATRTENLEDIHRLKL